MIELEGDDLINDCAEAGEGNCYQHQNQQQECPEEFNDYVLTKDGNDAICVSARKCYCNVQAASIEHKENGIAPMMHSYC